MFVGDPPGNYDRLLDVSRAVTGSLFFAPPATFLDDVATAATPASIVAQQIASSEVTAEIQPQSKTTRDSSLRVGSPKGEAGHK